MPGASGSAVGDLTSGMLVGGRTVGASVTVGSAPASDISVDVGWGVSDGNTEGVADDDAVTGGFAVGDDVAGCVAVGAGVCGLHAVASTPPTIKAPSR